MKRNGIDRHNNMIHRPKISLFFLLCIRWHAIKLLFGPRSFNNTLSPYRTILNIYRTHQMIQFFTLHNEFFMKMDFFVRVLVFWTHFVGDVSLCEPILFYSKGAGLFEQRSINIGILGIVFRTNSTRNYRKGNNENRNLDSNFALSIGAELRFCSFAMNHFTFWWKLGYYISNHAVWGFDFVGFAQFLF